MRSVNALYGNGADKLLEKFVLLTKETFHNDLQAAFMGIAYGGDVEMCARHWQGVGQVSGFDTFNDRHPDYLSYSVKSYEARCMDEVYQRWGTDELSLEWQQAELDRLGITNVRLVKGLVNANSCDDLPHLNLAWLDMDLNISMRTGFQAVANRLVPGGFLTTHDVVPQGHIPGNYEMFYQEFFDPCRWEEVCREPRSYFMAWRKLGPTDELHVITCCYRLHNLRTIASQLALGTGRFKLKWHLIFDGNHVTSESLKDYQDVLTLPFVEWSIQRDLANKSPTSGGKKTPSFSAANQVLDSISKGWVWINDDDNLAHPDFFRVLYGRSIELPSVGGWIVAQKGSGWIRHAHPTMVKVGSIDAGQFVLRRELIGDTRFSLDYGCDGKFIEELFQKHFNHISFDNRVLTYHNRLSW